MSHATFSVLVVDDEPRILEMVRLVLERHGRDDVDLRIRIAPDAADALRQMRESPADLVLTDHRMPGGSGAELLATIRREFPATHRLLMTGYHEIAEEDALHEATPALVVPKPFDVDGLRTNVLAALLAPPRRP